MQQRQRPSYGAQEIESTRICSWLRIVLLDRVLVTAARPGFWATKDSKLSHHAVGGARIFLLTPSCPASSSAGPVFLLLVRPLAPSLRRPPTAEAANPLPPPSNLSFRFKKTKSPALRNESTNAIIHSTNQLVNLYTAIPSVNFFFPRYCKNSEPVLFPCT
jgi:hypothetical protein